MPLKHEKPNPALIRELIEVRDAARDLNNLVKAASGLPNDFPLGPFENMLLSLMGLPDGTAADARPILHAADKRGVKLRHEYSKRPRAKEPQNAREFVPPFERGQKLDKSLSELRTALGTALEECRIQEIGDHPDEDFDPWGYDAVDNDPDVEGLAGQERRDLERLSHELDTAITETSDSVRGILNTETDNSDRLLRSLADLRNLNLITQAEASFAKGKSRVRESLHRAIEMKPKILVGFADAIESGTDFAEPLYKDWKAFKKDKMGYVLGKARTFSGFLRQHADRLTPPPPVNPEVQKAAEREAMLLLSKNRAVPDAVAMNVRELDIFNTGIGRNFFDISLLSNFTWIQSLDLYGTSVNSIDGLDAFAFLEELDVGALSIQLTPQLLQLSKLKVLLVQNLDELDISNFGRLKNLENLYLTESNVTDLSGLKHLKHLVYLDAHGCDVTDWSPVAHVERVRGRPMDWQNRS